MDTFEVDGWNNFCRVFEVPDQFPSDFCFGGGHPVNFQMVDWFYPVRDMGTPGVSKEIWVKEVGPIETKTVALNDLVKDLAPFLQQKQYVKAGREYLVICDFGAVFLVGK